MKVAILGFGVVGSGCYDVIKNASSDLEVKKVLDISIKEGYEGVMTTDINDILSDPEIEIVAETIGGLNPAFEFVSSCLKAGKNVVSSNKKLISEHFDELNSLADQNGVKLYFTSSSGGGIPWLSSLARAKRCDEIYEIRGIINGTTNYILDKMISEGTEFDAVLKEAQSLGYAEQDPTEDIDGLDVRRKCAISASVAFNTRISEHDIPVFGIREVKKDDIDYIESMGFSIRLMAYAKKLSDSVVAYVEPTIIRKTEPEAAVKENFNLISLWGRFAGRMSFYGQGAGKNPTGYGVVQDMEDIAEGVNLNLYSKTKSETDNSKEIHKYYIRSSIPFDIPCEKSKNVNGLYIYLTHPMSVESAHEIYNLLKEREASVFIAGFDIK